MQEATEIATQVNPDIIDINLLLYGRKHRFRRKGAISNR